MTIEILNSTRMPPRQRGRYKFINRLNISLYHHKELYFFVFIVQIASKAPFLDNSSKPLPYNICKQKKQAQSLLLAYTD